MNLEQSTVGEIVAKDARAAEIFERYAVDFCCNGHKTLQEACAGNEKADVLHTALQDLLADKATDADVAGEDFLSMPPDRLADHIETAYHHETTRQIPILQGHLGTLCRVHGVTHPELFEVRQLFEESAGELALHMKKEELILFPYIRNMVRSGSAPAAAFGSVENPIRALMHDHDGEGDRFRRMAELTNHYTVPPDGCATYSLTMQQLKEFERMLHFHIHLENNLLFPAVLAMAV